MRRQIPTVVFCVMALFFVGCHYDAAKAEKRREEFRYRLRDLAIEAVESESDFIGNGDLKNALLEVIRTQNPERCPSAMYCDADGGMLRWREVLSGNGYRGSVRIEFELMSKDRQAKLGIGIVRLVVRNKLGPDRTIRTRIRTLSPHQVREVEYLHSEDGEITPIKETMEERDTILLKQGK